jgi:hypothetical protein
MPPEKERLNALFLERAQRPPAKRVDYVVL